MPSDHAPRWLRDPNVISDEAVEAAQPGRPCALFLTRSHAPQTVQGSVTLEAAFGLNAAMQRQRSVTQTCLLGTLDFIESFWSIWGLDLGLLAMVVAACLSCTLLTLTLIPFVAMGMAAPSTVGRWVLRLSVRVIEHVERKT